MKLCPKCCKPNGRIHTRYGSYCRDCHNAACKISNRKRGKQVSAVNTKKRDKLRAYIISKKTGIPCADCGRIYPHYVMDHDHARGVKKGLISLAASRHWSLARLDEELEKCDLVCANCHRIRTHKRLGACGPAEKTVGYEPTDLGAHPGRPSNFESVV